MGLRKQIGRKLHHKITRSHIDEFIRSHATNELALDLGCGNSRYREVYPNRIGIDIVMGSGVDVVADAHDLPFRSCCVHTVVTSEMLEHTHSPQAVVDEIYRVVTPGGKAIMSTRFVFPIHEAPHDYFRFTEYGLRHLLREWKEISVRADSRPFEAIAALLQRMAYQSDLRGGRTAAWLCLGVARVLPLADRLIVRQYGDYHRRSEADSIMANGYLVSALKPGD